MSSPTPRRARSSSRPRPSLLRLPVILDSRRCLKLYARCFRMPLRKPLPLAVLLLAVSTAANGQRLPSGVGREEVSLYARLMAMTDTRQLDTALVARALSSKWQPLRAAATLAIGQIGAEPGLAGAPRLRALLKDSDATVAGNAAYALGLL